MTSFTHSLAGAALASLLTVGAQAETVSEPPADLSVLLDRGKQVYARECAACHGVEGDGEGPGAYILSQKPRNLQLGVFKLRSTPSGEFPTDSDLFETLTRGIQGATGAQMPSFAALPEEDRWALVSIIKDFALIDEPGTPIEVPAQPGANLALGVQVYERLQCASCHGDDGRGDGASSLTLKDDQKERIWTPDLRAGVYKGGDAPEEIYTRIFTGLDGSPMPAYGNKATPEEIWALTDYIRSLALPASEQ
jgi:cytochrome c oxidase cbb3-type subunit 2